MLKEVKPITSLQFERFKLAWKCNLEKGIFNIPSKVFVLEIKCPIQILVPVLIAFIQ